ncbi:glycine cleavage system protein GcvH [Fundicoccus culcitae]|uniref:Glycine cleavage system H protein n=1 Tax=Fundicoccus culcitae TaxID=2969821 RepID=A0ABY5P7H0_9LACT|nr:glycine cleavage system protein GcvH [Fundicoccus culcitae]UUX34348.1 glycine cleavage system protein GcvH [Fundicoccus culcitae]
MVDTKDLFYTEEHEWVEVLEDNKIRLGITQFAVDSLGDIVYVELPELEANYHADDEFAIVESVKSTSGIYTPATGVVSAVNAALVDEPELINNNPYVDGWLIEITLDEALDTSSLLDLEAYEKLIED